jgi:hypothetical protein
MDRRITAVKRDRAGKIVALCNVGQSWSPRRAQNVLQDIRAGRKSYYVQELPQRTYVRAAAGAELQTTPDAKSRNSLEQLPSV